MSVYKGPQSIRNGLIMCIDVTDKNSYVSGSSTILNLASTSSNFTLVNSPLYFTASSNLNSLSTSFSASAPYSFSYMNGTALPTSVTQLLYSDHTIEICCKINSLTPLSSFSSSYTTETVTSMLIWPGFHSGLYMDTANIYYLIWNGVAGAVQTSASISSYVGSNIMLTATRSSSVLYIYVNGTLLNQTTIGTTATNAYTSLRLGCANIVGGDNFNWPNNVNYYSVKLYNRWFSQSNVTQNYTVMQKRLGL